MHGVFTSYEVLKHFNWEMHRCPQVVQVNGGADAKLYDIICSPALMFGGQSASPSARTMTIKNEIGFIKF